ncbi:MAG TPA: hypothetical protein VNJ54_21185 [Plantibacter sp.]|uniref:hypothetical protein n=1 Tax=unclassified Plantibacter TaxID=2624265 RepID=UPI002C395B4C|nr:hypothetical protein [Plantibacter sp.]
MTEGLPLQYELSFSLGEIVRNDKWAENEMKNLWMRLAQSGLAEGAPQRDFARVTKDARRMLNLESVPSAFRALALPSLEAAHRAHQRRREYVHQTLIQPAWAQGQLRPAIGSKPAIHMSDLVKCAEDLRVAMWRLRGLGIIAPCYSALCHEVILAAGHEPKVQHLRTLRRRSSCRTSHRNIPPTRRPGRVGYAGYRSTRDHWLHPRSRWDRLFGGLGTKYLHGGMVKFFDSVGFLTLALLVFLGLFFSFLFFNEDLIAKLFVCAFSGIFAAVVLIRLLQLTRK